jgi:hypothetical protein
MGLAFAFIGIIFTLQGGSSVTRLNRFIGIPCCLLAIACALYVVIALIWRFGSLIVQVMP